MRGIERKRKEGKNNTEKIVLTDLEGEDAMKRTRRIWTDTEKEFLRKHYLEPGGPAMVAQETKRSPSSVRGKAIGLGLRIGHRALKCSEHRDRHQEKARPVPKGLNEGGKCPGKGSGECGKILRQEGVRGDGGFCVAGMFDLICEAGHRFSLPAGGK